MASELRQDKAVGNDSPPKTLSEINSLISRKTIQLPREHKRQPRETHWVFRLWDLFRPMCDWARQFGCFGCCPAGEEELEYAGIKELGLLTQKTSCCPSCPSCPPPRTPHPSLSPFPSHSPEV